MLEKRYHRRHRLYRKFLYIILHDGLHHHWQPFDHVHQSFLEHSVDASQLQLCWRGDHFLFTGSCKFIVAHMTRVAPFLRYLRASTCFRNFARRFRQSFLTCASFFAERGHPRRLYCLVSSSSTCNPITQCNFYCSCKLLRIADIYPRSFSGGFVAKAQKRCKTAKQVNSSSLKEKWL